MSKTRWPLWGGLVAALALFALPLLLVVWIGWPSAAPAAGGAIPAGRRPLIAPPSLSVGLPLDLIYWLLFFAGSSLGFALAVGLAMLLLRRQPLAPRPRLFLLAVLGLVSLLTYVLNFVLPFPLHRYYNLGLVCMGWIADRDAGVALATAAATLSLFFLYGLAYLVCRGQAGRRWWGVVLIVAVLLALANFFVVTTTSTDIYDNIARGRITDVYGGNPYVHVPVDYPLEPYEDYISWDDATSAYGPLWETLAAFLSRLAGDHLWDNVVAHKALALVSHCLSTALIAATLRRIAPGRALAGTLLFAWNPLVLMEGVANAHNDLLMVALLVGAFWFLSQGDRTPGQSATRDLVFGGLALIFLAASVLLKFVPGLFFPFFLLYLLIPARSWRRRLGLGLLLLAPAALLVADYYGVFWEWPAVADTFARRAEMFRMSVPSAAVNVLRPLIGEEAAMATVRGPFLWAFVLCYLALLARTTLGLKRALAPEREWPAIAWPEPLRRAGRILFGSGDPGTGAPMDVLIRACLTALILYLLLANFWFWPWYLIWPLALLALSDDERLLIPLALTSCAGELAHVGWNFVWYWWGITWDTLYQMDSLVILGLVVPALLAYMILGFLRRRRRRLQA